MEQDYLYSHLIENIKNKIFFLNVDNVGIILKDIRKVIEHTNTNKEYTTLNFYCDWAAHALIARNPKMYEMLDLINVKFDEIVIKDSAANKKYDNYGSIIIDALCLDKLAFEIRKFLFLNFIHLDYPFVSEFIKYTFENVMFVVIQYPKDKKKDKKKDATIKRSKEICKIINEKEKYINPKLDSNFDYQNPVFCDSFQIKKVTSNTIKYEMGIENNEKKHMKITGYILLK